MVSSERTPLVPHACRLFVVLFTCLALAATPLTGGPWIAERRKLLAADETTWIEFGTSVAVSGDTAIVGASFANGGTGAAYVFVRTSAGWSQQARLVPSDGSQYGSPMSFGSDVEISGETAFVAAYQGHPNVMSGAVYIFVRNGSSWSEQAKLVAPDAFSYDGFACSLAVSGNTLVVGASGSDSTPAPSPFGRGAVYVFVRSGSSWSLQAKLFASYGGVFSKFGESVALEGDTLAVGMPTNAFVGSVFIFRRSGSSWQEQASLLASDFTTTNVFGWSIALSGNTLVVGAPRRVRTEDVGAAYVFVDNGSSWSEQAKLLAFDAPDGEPAYRFGWGTALSGDTLVVTDPNSDDDGWPGKAYLFVRNGSTWSEHTRLHASDGKPADGFGDSAAISGGTVFIGAPYADDPGVSWEAGAAYLFSAPGVLVAPTGLLITQEETPFSVSLDTKPAGEVVIDLASSDSGAGTVSPDRLTFTLSDWATPQTVNLTRVAGSGPPYTIALSMNQNLTDDAFYDGLDPEDVSAIPLEFAGDFYIVTPCRVLDTRQPDQGPPLTAGVKRVVAFQDRCGVPATARAVAIALTVVQPTRGGHLSLYPSNFPCSDLDQLTFSPGWSRTINSIVLLATDGTGTLTVSPLVAGGGSAHLVIDVGGYFE